MGEAQQSNAEQGTVVERFGLESVPVHLRTTTAVEYSMTQIALSVNAGNFLVPAIAVLEGGLSFSYAVFATVVGAAAAFLLTAVMALPGAKYGIPSQYAIRTIMGVNGARYLASPVRTIGSLYWFAVQTIGGAYLLKEILERAFPIHVPFIPLSLCLAISMAILALIGFEALKRITKYFLPILFLGGIVMLYIFITSEVGGMTFKDVLAKKGDNQVGTVIFFASLGFVQYINAASSSSDLARYAKTANHAFYGLLTGKIIGFTLTATLGAYAATLAGSLNPFVTASQLTDSTLFLFIIFIAAMASMITINLNNAYSGGYSLLNSLPKLGRVRSSIVFGITAITLSAFPALVEEAKVYISLLGVLIIPISAVIVSDFLCIKKKVLSSNDIERLANLSYRYNREGLLAVLIGVILYVSLPEVSSPGFVTFLCTGLLYLFFKNKVKQ